jgi:hypothetical protein
VKPFKGEIAHGPGVNSLLNNRNDPLTDEYAASCGFTAQPSGKVWDAANNRVVPALVETNPPYCSVAASDTNTETQGVALLKPMPGNLAQFITHL